MTSTEMQDVQSPEQRRAAFEAVTIPFMKNVYNRALQLTRRTDVAADLVQETFLHAFRTFDNFATGTNARAWLLTILYSRFVTLWRHQRREPEEVSLDDDAESIPAASGAAAAATLDPKLWASEEVYEALTRLPHEARAVLLMVDVDDLSYEQVASVLNCPVGTVRSRLSRARKATCAALEQYARTRGLFGRKP